MILNKPRENTLTPPQFAGDALNNTEPDVPFGSQGMRTLPPPQIVEPDVPQTAAAPTGETSPMPNPATATLPPPRTALQTAEEKYNTLQNQQTPKDNDKGFLRRLGATLREFGKRALAGGAAAGPNASMSERLWASLGGGLAGTVGYQFDPQVDERENLQNQRARAWREYQLQNEMEKQRLERDKTAAATATIYNDDARQQQATNDLKTYRDGLLLETAAKRESNELNTKMRTVASMWSKLSNYDSADPRFAEITKAMGDLNLPLTPKDSKKVVKQIQDAETGAWSLTLTDPVSGQQEVRPITTKDGKQLVTTSTAKVMANAAGERQQSQQNFQATENEKNRQMRKQLQEDAQKYGREQTLIKAVNAFKNAYQRNNGTLPTQAEIDEFQQAAQTNLDSPIE